MISDEELRELMLLPLCTFGADPKTFMKPNWGMTDDEQTPEEEKA